MYMYYKKKNYWNLKIILSGVIAGTLVIFLSSWAEVAAEHSCDYHVETPSSDWQSQNDAQEASKNDGPQTYTDQNGTTHIYEDGKEHC